MKPVSIKLIAEALESAMDEWQQFLDLETGLIHQLPEDPWEFNSLVDNKLSNTCLILPFP